MEHLKNQINVVRSSILAKIKPGQPAPEELVYKTIEILNKALEWDLNLDEIDIYLAK